MISYEHETLSIYLNKYYVSPGKRVEKSNGKFFFTVIIPEVWSPPTGWTASD